MNDDSKAKIKTERVADVVPPKPTDIELHLRQRVAQLLSENASLHRERGSLAIIAEDIKSVIIADPPRKVIYRPPSKVMVKSPVSAVLGAADWHGGAVQEPDEIEGFDEYGPDILWDGVMNRLVPSLLKKFEIQRLGGYTLDELVVLGLGDMINGDIQDNRVTNAFPSPKQVVYAADLFTEMVLAFAPHFPKVRVEFMTDDNHGRLTKKPQCKQGGLNNLCYLVGMMAKARLERQKNVEFNVHPMYQKTVEVKKRRYLLAHGHNVSGWLGFPYYGIERMAAKEAFKRMVRRLGEFDKVVCGHWHAPLEHEWYIICGSAQGTDAYDHRSGRSARGMQTAWFVSPTHGEFDKTNWVLR